MALSLMSNVKIKSSMHLGDNKEQNYIKSEKSSALFSDGVYSFKHDAFREGIHHFLVKRGGGANQQRHLFLWKPSAGRVKKQSQDCLCFRHFLLDPETGRRGWRTVAECLLSCSISLSHT